MGLYFNPRTRKECDCEKVMKKTSFLYSFDKNRAFCVFIPILNANNSRIHSVIQLLRVRVSQGFHVRFGFALEN